MTKKTSFVQNKQISRCKDTTFSETMRKGKNFFCLRFQMAKKKFRNLGTSARCADKISSTKPNVSKFLNSLDKRFSWRIIPGNLFLGIQSLEKVSFKGLLHQNLLRGAVGILHDVDAWTEFRQLHAVDIEDGNWLG
jgi:hypothetical protein